MVTLVSFRLYSKIWDVGDKLVGVILRNMTYERINRDNAKYDSLRGKEVFA